MSLASIPYHAFSQHAIASPRVARWRAAWVRVRPVFQKLVLLGVLGTLLYGSAMLGLLTLGLRSAPRGADVMLVLGTTVSADGVPGALLLARLDRAVELYKAGFSDTVIVSGGPGRGGVDEATTMRNYLIARGVPSVAVVADSTGVDTYSSALFTARYLRNNALDRVLIVSQSYHLPRATFALQRFGVTQVSAAPAYGMHAKDPYGLAREVPACLYYALRNYTEPQDAAGLKATSPPAQGE